MEMLAVMFYLMRFLSILKSSSLSILSFSLYLYSDFDDLATDLLVRDFVGLMYDFSGATDFEVLGIK